MGSTLESVQWGRKALQLIEQIKKMDTIRPVILHLRHSIETSLHSPSRCDTQKYTCSIPLVA